MLQKYINCQQKILKQKDILYVKEIFQEISVNDIKKTRLNGCVYNFSVRYTAFGTSNIINIHKYLMKKQNLIIYKK